MLLPAAMPGRGDEWGKKFQISGKAELHVVTSDGDVAVRAGDETTVSAHVFTKGWRIAPTEVKVTGRQAGDRIDLEVRLPHFHWNSGGRSVRIELSMPRRSDLEIRTNDGSITADGVHGHARFSTGDGNIRASGLEGTLEAASGDGNINVEGRFELLTVRSGDGAIDARVNSGSQMAGAWTFRSGDGNLTLCLPQSFSADLDLHTGDGHIDLDFPVSVSGSLRENEVRGKMNGGGMSLTAHTGDGSIHLVRVCR